MPPTRSAMVTSADRGIGRGCGRDLVILCKTVEGCVPVPVATDRRIDRGCGRDAGKLYETDEGWVPLHVVKAAEYIATSNQHGVTSQSALVAVVMKESDIVP